jgi:hypothetical protein
MAERSNDRSQAATRGRAWPRAIRWAAPYYAIWLFAAGAAAYFKWHLLCHSGFRDVSQSLGRAATALNDAAWAGSFSWLERLSFFRSDLLWEFVVLPAVVLVLLRGLPVRWRLPCLATATLLFIAALTIQLRGYWYFGTFPSWTMWDEAVRWGLRHPDDTRAYLRGAASWRWGVYLLATGGAAAYCWRRQKRVPSPARRTGLLAQGGAVALLALTGLAWCVPMTPTPYHRSTLALCLSALLGPRRDETPDDARPTADVMRQWRRLTDTPAPLPPGSELFGAAQGYDVLCCVWETAPAWCLDADVRGYHLPHLQRLRQRGWWAANHLTTSPFTRCALFALLTSRCATDIRLAHDVSCGTPVPSLLWSLRRHDYVTAVYQPEPPDRWDEAFLQAVGFEQIVHPPLTVRRTVAADAAERFAEKMRHDRTTLESLQRDIAAWIERDQRYAVLFLPQLGHAPWPEVVEGRTLPEIRSRGRAVLALQDRWLGELLTQLAKAGRLQRTVILVTADHGIRSRVEAPDFGGGVLDPRSFQVPCLLFAPGILQQPAVISGPTSHIDLAPSLLHLVGGTEGRGFELGSPLWDERIRRRTTFLWADELLGADGFYAGGRYYQWQRLSDTTCSHDTFDFLAVRSHLRGSPIDKFVRSQISTATGIQRRLARQQAIPGPEVPGDDDTPREVSTP